jgi:hypothetical protein
MIMPLVQNTFSLLRLLDTLSIPVILVMILDECFHGKYALSFVEHSICSL